MTCCVCVWRCVGCCVSCVCCVCLAAVVASAMHAPPTQWLPARLLSSANAAASVQALDRFDASRRDQFKDGDADKRAATKAKREEDRKARQRAREEREVRRCITAAARHSVAAARHSVSQLQHATVCHSVASCGALT